MANVVGNSIDKLLELARLHEAIHVGHVTRDSQTKSAQEDHQVLQLGLLEVGKDVGYPGLHKLIECVLISLVTDLSGRVKLVCDSLYIDFSATD